MEQYTEKTIQRINQELKAYLAIKYPEIIYEAMNYSVFAGGKRIRPLLLIAAYEAFAENIDNAMPFACAIELIHTYSCIHDDLPAMDDDDYRRGKLTSHKVYGEAMAVLCGDALLNKAFEIMSEYCLRNFERNHIEAMKIISNASGIDGMIGGQVVDIVSENKNTNDNTDKTKLERDLLFIHEHKTAAIIKACACAGAILGGANKKDYNLIAEASGKLGLAFQIKDDILDVTSSKEILGKDVLKDMEKKKLTYISLYGLEASKLTYNKLCEEALSAFRSLGSKSSMLLHISEKIVSRGN